jgi:HK97 family phage portal protein
MIKDFFTRLIGVGSTGSSFLPYFGPSMTNYSGFANKSPEGLASVQRSIAILSDACCSTPIAVMKSLPTGGYEAVTTTGIAKGLKRLKYRDLDVAITSALFTGNGFIRVIRDLGKVSFQAIASNRVQMATDKSGNIYYQIAADVSLGEETIIIPAKEMVHIRPKVSRENPLMGISPLAQIHQSLPAICDAHFLMGALSKNLATPGLILATEMSLQKDQVTRLRDAADQQSSAYKTGGTLILSSGLKPVASQVNQSIKDQDLIAALAFSTIEVSRVFGIPATLLGDTAATSFNTASELHRSFQRTTVKPLMARVADAFTEALLSDDDIDSGLEISFENADYGSGKEAAETLSTLVNAGIYSINEVRNILGKPDTDSGDVMRSPLNTAPIADWLDYYKQPQQQAPGNQ